MLYESFLLKIHSGENIELTLRSFELDMLEMLGYGIDFENEIDKNQSIDANKNYSFIPQRGFRESRNSHFFRKRHYKYSHKKPFRSIKKTSQAHYSRDNTFCLDGRDLSSREIFLGESSNDFWYWNRHSKDLKN